MNQSLSDVFVVLVAEDEPLVRMNVSCMLTSSGFSVVEAENGDKALSILRARGDINALLTDIEMPGSINGLGLAKIARAEFPFVRIVVVSGHARPDIEELPDGTPFFSKPYDEQAIVDILRERVPPVPRSR